MDEIERLIRSCRDWKQAEDLTSDRDELERARYALESLEEDDYGGEEEM